VDVDPSLEDDLLRIFLVESQENLAAIEAGLVALEESPEDPDTLNTVFRAAHTLKGNAASVGYKRVTEFAHVLEDLLDRLRDQRIAVTSSIIEVLLRSTDFIR
jgi:two-component system chemotaxis sensor kinase CheA